MQPRLVDLGVRKAEYAACGSGHTIGEDTTCGTYFKKGSMGRCSTWQSVIV